MIIERDYRSLPISVVDFHYADVIVGPDLCVVLLPLIDVAEDWDVDAFVRRLTGLGLQFETCYIIVHQIGCLQGYAFTREKNHVLCVLRGVLSSLMVSSKRFTCKFKICLTTSAEGVAQHIHHIVQMYCSSHTDLHRPYLTADVAKDEVSLLEYIGMNSLTAQMLLQNHTFEQLFKMGDTKLEKNFPSVRKFVFRMFVYQRYKRRQAQNISDTSSEASCDTSSCSGRSVDSVTNCKKFLSPHAAPHAVRTSPHMARIQPDCYQSPTVVAGNASMRENHPNMMDTLNWNNSIVIKENTPDHMRSCGGARQTVRHPVVGQVGHPGATEMNGFHQWNSTDMSSSPPANTSLLPLYTSTPHRSTHQQSTFSLTETTYETSTMVCEPFGPSNETFDPSNEVCEPFQASTEFFGRDSHRSATSRFLNNAREHQSITDESNNIFNIEPAIDNGVLESNIFDQHDTMQKTVNNYKHQNATIDEYNSGFVDQSDFILKDEVNSFFKSPPHIEIDDDDMFTNESSSMFNNDNSELCPSSSQPSNAFSSEFTSGIPKPWYDSGETTESSIFDREADEKPNFLWNDVKLEVNPLNRMRKETEHIKNRPIGIFGEQNKTIASIPTAGASRPCFDRNTASHPMFGKSNYFQGFNLPRHEPYMKLTKPKSSNEKRLTNSDFHESFFLNCMPEQPKVKPQPAPKKPYTFEITSGKVRRHPSPPDLVEASSPLCEAPVVEALKPRPPKDLFTDVEDLRDQFPISKTLKRRIQKITNPSVTDHVRSIKTLDHPHSLGNITAFSKVRRL